MIKRSVLIPQHNLGEATASGLPELFHTLKRMRHSFEVIVIDDGSSPPTQDLLRGLLVQFPGLRILWMKNRTGLSAAISVGVAAARGEEIVAIEPGRHYRPQQIPLLLERLVRADLVCGRRESPGWVKLWRKIARTPKWGLMGIQSRDADCLFWAARKEAIAGVSLASGMHRYLPEIVSARGYRVIDFPVHPRGASLLQPERPANPVDLLAAWWTTKEIISNQQKEIVAVRDSNQRKAA